MPVNNNSFYFKVAAVTTMSLVAIMAEAVVNQIHLQEVQIHLQEVPVAEALAVLVAPIMVGAVVAVTVVVQWATTTKPTTT